jgi:hypothetical protein
MLNTQGVLQVSRSFLEASFWKPVLGQSTAAASVVARKVVA